jgi:bacterioferritin
MNREKSIEILNKAIGEELLAVDQYMYFHFVCDDRGYEPFAAIFKKLAIVEMIHVEKLAERVFFLKGDVLMKRPAGSEQIKDPKAMLDKAKELEQTSIDHYNQWARELADNMDSVSKRLLESINEEEEDHFDIFDTEDDNIKDFGDHYLALQAIDHSRKMGQR